MNVPLINGDRLKIYWVHNPPGRTTQCVIAVYPLRSVEHSLPKAVYTGLAFCSISDIYDKNTGRKVGLTRALRDSGFDRGTRLRVWYEYGRMRGGKW